MDLACHVVHLLASEIPKVYRFVSMMIGERMVIFNFLLWVSHMLPIRQICTYITIHRHVL